MKKSRENRHGGKTRKQKKVSPTKKYLMVNIGKIGIAHQEIKTLERNPLHNAWASDPETRKFRKENNL